MSCFRVDWYVARPYTVFWRTFAALDLLFCATTPFMDDIPNRWTFLFAGFVYSAVLSFLATGLLLIPYQSRRRIYTMLGIFVAIDFLQTGLLLSSLHFLRIHHIVLLMTQAFVWVSSAFGVATFAFASYGWYDRLAGSGVKD